MKDNHKRFCVHGIYNSTSRRRIILLTGFVAMTCLFAIKHMNNDVLDNTTGNLSYSCPSFHVSAEIDKEQDFYREKNTHLFKNGEPDFSSFRDKPFDAWHNSYNELKSLFKDWKLKAFGDNLSGNGNEKIYESACGSGFNLLLTLEILAEHRDMRSLEVHGSDYISSSVNFASQLLAAESPAGSSVGHFCSADSSNLSHVPDESFDLVFTGYIDPIDDPMDIGLSDDEIYEKWVEQLCQKDSEISKKLRMKAQRIQEDWYAKWVTELIRIAKPGKAVIIESVGYPLCSHEDWGGVEKEWWNATAISRYGWDVDPSSFLMEDYILGSDRYNVIMRKNDKSRLKVK